MKALVLLAFLLSACQSAAPRPSAQTALTLPVAVTPSVGVSSEPRTGAPFPSATSQAESATEALTTLVPGGAPTPRPTGGIGKPATGVNPNPPEDGVTGTATWFEAPWGTAAAGPALRDYLGTDWRGTVVSVTAPGCSCPPVFVLLNDWCFCGSGRVIDLNRAQFANLAMPSKGVIKVVVREERP